MRVPKAPRVSATQERMKRFDYLRVKAKQAFNVSVRKGGKFVEIGKGLPEGEAMKLGTETTEKTLRASFRLTPGGTTTKKDIYFDFPNQRFTLPVPGSRIRAPLTYIEKPTYRLSTRTEVREIQSSRNSVNRIIGGLR